MMNLSNYWDKDKIQKNSSSIKRIFFYRICGMGMGTCATLLKSSGFLVEGADSVFFPPMSDYLKSQDIKCYSLTEVNPELLNKYDLVVVGNSVGRHSDDARMIEESGVAFTSFPTLMGELVLKDKEVIGIAGTHGKTTTSYYLTQILDNLNQSPGHFVGGVLKDRAPSAVGSGKFFVIESDEYDSSYFEKFAKFRSYEINHLILTSLEYDHADIYDSVEAIEQEFLTITDHLDSVIGNTDYKSVVKVSQNAQTKFTEYGMASSSGPLNIRYDNGQSFFDVSHGSENYHFHSNVIGDHNILNLTSCILFCLNNGFSFDQVQNAISNLSNVKRRQENRGKYQSSIIIDDFAHHPTSVLLTIDAISKAYPNKDIHCVIEPSTSTARSVAFQDSFIPSFKGASSVLLCDPSLPTNAKQFENLNYDKLAKDIGAHWNIHSACTKKLEVLRDHIDKYSQDDSVLLIMGNRTILGLWESDFVKKIS